MGVTITRPVLQCSDGKPYNFCYRTGPCHWQIWLIDFGVNPEFDLFPDDADRKKAIWKGQTQCNVIHSGCVSQ